MILQHLPSIQNTCIAIRFGGLADIFGPHSFISIPKGLNPLVLTERREHLDLLDKRLAPMVPNLVVLTGGMNQKQRKAAALKLQEDGP